MPEILQREQKWRKKLIFPMRHLNKHFKILKFHKLSCWFHFQILLTILVPVMAVLRFSSLVYYIKFLIFAVGMTISSALITPILLLRPRNVINYKWAANKIKFMSFKKNLFQNCKQRVSVDHKSFRCEVAPAGRWKPGQRANLRDCCKPSEFNWYHRFVIYFKKLYFNNSRMFLKD